MSHAPVVSGAHRMIFDGMEESPIRLERCPLEHILRAMKANRSDVQPRLVVLRR